MRRLAAICGLLVATATGAWAIPAGQADPTVAPTAAEPEVVAPSVALPDIAANTQSAERQSVPTTEAPAATPAPVALEPASDTRFHTDEPADHLATDDPAPAPEVIAVVTTTIAPPTTTTTSPPAPIVTVAFTATQAYGSCGEDIPYDIFSGTATPGTTVNISSPHGGGSTVADGDGHWEKTVEFPAAPRNETFQVNLSGLGGSTSLSFTATGGSH